MSNISPTLERMLLPAQRRWLHLVSGVAERHDVEVFLVGGTVRDMMLGMTPADLDITVVGLGPEFPNALSGELDGEVVARSQFVTYKLRVEGAILDVAMARKESYAHPGALPSVAPGSIEEDLARRDFSINALAVSLVGNTWGELLDPFDGRGDLERRLVRALHPQSFVDDATRILRAVRYSQRLDFRLEAETERWLRRNLSYLDTISGDRVRHEFERIFLEREAPRIIGATQELGVLRAVYPALELNDSLLSKLHSVKDARISDRSLAYLSLLAYSLPRGQEEGFISRLNMDTRWAGVVRDTAAIKDSFERLREPDLSHSRLYRMLMPFDDASIEGCELASDEPLVRQRLRLFLRELRGTRTMLNGDDLIALGVPEGPQVGTLLYGLLEARLDGLVRTREDEETFVRQRLRQMQGC